MAITFDDHSWLMKWGYLPVEGWVGLLISDGLESFNPLHQSEHLFSRWGGEYCVDVILKKT